MYQGRGNLELRISVPTFRRIFEFSMKGKYFISRVTIEYTITALTYSCCATPPLHKELFLVSLRPFKKTQNNSFKV